MNMWSKPIVFVLITSGIVFPEIVGYLRDDYRFFSNYLSEFGAIDAPFYSFIKFAGFLPVGLAISFLVIVLRQQLPRISSVRGGLICLLGIALAVTSGFVLMLVTELQQVRGATQRLADTVLRRGFYLRNNRASVRCR